MRKLVILLLLSTFAIGQGVPSKAPFTITIALENSTVKAGEEVWIKVSIKNDSNRALDDSGGISDRTRIDPNLRFEVRDQGGKLAPKRIYQHPEIDTGSPLNRTIAPGETLTLEQRPSTLFDMNKPGKYAIQVSRRASDNPKDGEIKSNQVEVTIIP